MTVGIAGSGPAAESVERVLADEGIDAIAIEPDRIGEVELAVVVDRVGASAFGAANEAALSGTGTEWIGVELGGIGGRTLDDVDATVCGFGPDTGCFECLSARVAANDDPGGRDDIRRSMDRGGSTPSGDGDSATARLAGTIGGREVRRTLAGAPIGGVIELPYAERVLLAVPGCRCHNRNDPSDRFETLDLEYENRSLDDAVTRAERALDPRLGIVGSIGEAASFPVPYYLASLRDTAAFSDARATPQAAGVAADWDRAFMKAIGEALERYCAGVYRTVELTEARASELDQRVAPSEFVSPGNEERVDDEPIRWVPGEALESDTRTLLPASVVLFPPPDERFRPAITTGLGLGNSATQALLSGLYEVIERDATMLGWYSTFEPLGLRVETEKFETLRRRARAADLSTTALLVTQDVDVPVVCVAVHRESEWPRFAVGSGAALNATQAAESALAEALQNWTELRGMGRENASESEGAIGHYAAFPSIAQSFVDVGHAIPAAEVGASTTGTDELNAVVKRLASVGLDAYASRLTTRDVEELGFEAVRAVVPAAQPLFTGEPFFGERARAVPENLGFEPRLDREPHPYP